MANNNEILSITEQSTVSEAIIRLINSMPGIPVKAEWQYMGTGEAIGAYTMPGAVYLRKDVLGGFVAQFPFLIRYQAMPTNSAGRINKQKVLDDLGEWLEKATFPPLTSNRVIETIERTTTSFLLVRDQAGNEIYQCNMMLKYRKEG